MLATLKAVLNSYNQRKYIKNINDIKLESLDDGDYNTNNIRNKEGSKDEIERLETRTRIHNLDVFYSNYWGIRKYRFLYVTMPALLAVATAFTIKAPSEADFNSKGHKYTEETTTYSSSEGVSIDTRDTYDLNPFFEVLGYKIVSEDGAQVRPYTDNRVELKIHDYEKAVTSNYSWKSNGNLAYLSYSTVLEYLDTDDLKGIDFENIENEEEYIVLFDRLINILKDSGYVGKKDKELIDSLVDSEKREIILKTIKYVDEGKEDVVIGKSMNVEKIIFYVAVFLYYLYVYLIYYRRKSSYSVHDYEINNGRLYQKENKRVPGSLFDETLRVKEAYLAAERDRILKLWDEIKKNVAPQDRGKILTKHERKLITKHTKDNVPKN